MDQHVSTSAAPPPEQSAPPPEPPSRGKPRSDVLEVFEYWRSKLRKSAATQLDGKRRKRIEWALRTYGLETVKRCIDGYAGSAWHRGENDRHKPFDDLELWLRDAKHVEEGLGYALGDGARRSRGALPPSAIDADSAAESQRRAAEILGPSLFGVGT